MTIWLATVLLSATVLAGCSGKGGSGQGPETGFFTGFEVGNEDDQAEIRKDRPGYRPHE
jgi:hypothetical protein